MANPNKAPRKRRQVGYEGYPSIATRKYPALTHFQGYKIPEGSQVWGNYNKLTASSVKKRLIAEGYTPASVRIRKLNDGSYLVLIPKKK